MFDALFTGEGLLFSLPALAGSFVFLIKIGLMAIVGVDGDADVGVAVDGDVDVNLGDDAHDSSHAFSLLSVQSIAAILMGFGWGGLTARFALDWTLPLSVLSGLAVAALMVWLLGLMMKGMYDLQSSGNIRLDDTVGLHGTVYASVPAAGKGRGKLRLVVNQRSRIFDAISEGGALATNAKVKVVRANGDNTVTVAESKPA